MVSKELEKISAENKKFLNLMSERVKKIPEHYELIKNPLRTKDCLCLVTEK